MNVLFENQICITAQEFYNSFFGRWENKKVDLNLLEYLFMHFSKEQEQTINVLCKAVREKKLIKFFYKSKKTQKKEWRTIEPYLVGMYRSNQGFFVSGWFLPSKQQLAEGHEPEHKNYSFTNIGKSSLKTLSKAFKAIKVSREKIDETKTIEIICKVSFEDE
jgi:hypothetical protein